jgi:beta-glucanase (GH16 family)
VGLSLLAIGVSSAITYQAMADDAKASGAPGEQWPTAFADEFNGDQVDKSKWSIYSDAESDQCLGNQGNKQLEWHTWDSLSEADGHLTITARKNSPHSGYDWSSGLITTGHACDHGPDSAFAVKPGDYIETRLKLPEEKGFWPSTWTWNGDGSNEQDTYEYYSDNPRKLYLTNQTDKSGCEYAADADLTGDWHTIGEQIGPDKTVWYLDGKKLCDGGAYSGDGALLVDMFVFADIPPTVDKASMDLDYVRVHREG